MVSRGVRFVGPGAVAVAQSGWSGESAIGAASDGERIVLERGRRGADLARQRALIPAQDCIRCIQRFQFPKKTNHQGTIDHIPTCLLENFNAPSLRPVPIACHCRAAPCHRARLAVCRWRWPCVGLFGDAVRRARAKAPDKNFMTALLRLAIVLNCLRRRALSCRGLLGALKTPYFRDNAPDASHGG